MGRGRQRARYDRETVHAILDAGLICHIAFCIDGQPFLTPTTYGRDGDQLYLHGALANRTLKHLAAGAPAAIGVSILDGLVLARSQTHSGMNFRSVMLFGRATEVTELAAKRHALARIVEQVVPGRTQACRPPSEAELEATKVLAFLIEEASAKIREGGPGDEEGDLALPHWAGELPLQLTPQAPRAAANLAEGLPAPDHVLRWKRRAGS